MSTTPQNPTQNQSPIPISSPASIIPNRNPTPTPTPNPPSHALKSPSFDEVSNLFSLPLSYAADSLGVCPTVLKKLCYDNGLVRWPYRKFLSGKSIEEIKKDAAVEKEKNLAELKVYGVRNNSLARGPQPQSTNTISQQESSTVKILPQQPNKDNQIQSSQIMKIGNSTISDEFKYGFPSDGLSSVSYRWWGNKSGGENVVDTLQRVDENADERKEQREGKVDCAASLSSMDDEVMTQGKKNDEPVCLLSVLRKKAAKDGLHALKLGVYRGYSDGKNMDRTKKMMLVQIFKSSLPSEWGDMYSES
ncbi:hypothetical protein ACP275_13G049500 [Erythranthe tilingii]